jgi:hypothetical protein
MIQVVFHFDTVLISKLANAKFENVEMEGLD